MGGLAGIFKGLLGGDPVKSVTDLISEFHMSPDDKAKLQEAAQQLSLHRDEIVAARDEALAELQSKNITTETSSSDGFVRRARPAFLWMMILAMGVNLIIFPVLNAAMHRGLTMLEIPASYLDLFGAAFLGYAGMRTWEKTKSKD
ncbi:MAG TPA: 3TM-type holin [Terriglobia bacterium]|nr:3TM-type holin [Terriglobia bacterium]